MSLAVERTRTVKGAACGALAAAVWALEQPLDKTLLSCGYDDVELLGRAIRPRAGWYPVGFAMHVWNGAVFGAIYSNLAPSLPLPPTLRGPALALAEHVALWPLAGVSDRLHPARHEMVPLAGNRRAYAQAALRHLLFGLVLGELERRLNAQPDHEPSEPRAEFSSNGHGSLEHAVPLGS